jgi:hypothetical protein
MSELGVTYFSASGEIGVVFAFNALVTVGKGAVAACNTGDMA